MNEPIGLLGSLMPALALMIASLTRCRAFSCPITFLFKFISKFSNLSLSLPTSLLTGIDVHLEIILAISSSSTVSDNISDLFFCCNSFNSLSSLGIVPCLNLAAVSKS